jgi:methylthioxylose transferase
VTAQVGRKATLLHAEANPPRLSGGRRGVVAWSLVAVTAALAGTAAWGAALQHGGTDLTLFAAPFFADWGPRRSRGLVLPVVLALLIARYGPVAARVVPWRRLLVVAWVTTVAWGVALSASTGWAGLTRSVRSRYDYAASLPVVRRVGLGPYVATYVSRLHDAPTHVKSHPPGMVVLLRGLELLGLRGSGWAAAVLIAVTATVPVGVAVTLHRMGVAGAARAVLPFLVCGPWTLLVATVADGVFAAAVVWGIALLAAAASARDRRTAAALALASGAGLACSLYLSYGLVPLVAALTGAVLLSTRRYQLIPSLLAGATAVVAVWTLAGFRWLEGFSAARAFYRLGPYSFFVVANLVVVAVMLGPAVIAAWAQRPRRSSDAVPRSSEALDPFVMPLRWLAGASLLAMAVADLSGLSKGEVERIWLPFVPFATLVVVRLASSRRVSSWLAAQAAVAIALQTLLVWPW